MISLSPLWYGLVPFQVDLVCSYGSNIQICNKNEFGKCNNLLQ